MLHKWLLKPIIHTIIRINKQEINFHLVTEHCGTINNKKLNYYGWIKTKI